MNLFYREFGTGKPIVIIHGLFGMSDNWVLIAKQIAAHGYRVILPDLRNHGKSFHSSRFDYPAMAQDIVTLFNNLCIQKAIICGHSMGGKVAMHCAQLFPERISKLVVADMGVRAYRLHSQEIVEAMLHNDFITVKTRAEVEQKLSNVITEPQVLQLIMKNLDRTGYKFSWKLNVVSVKNNFNEIFKAFQPSEKIAIPTLFIKGGGSDYIKPEDMEDIRYVFPTATLSIIPNASHWLHVDNPELFIQSLLDFAGKD